MDTLDSKYKTLFYIAKNDQGLTRVSKGNVYRKNRVGMSSILEMLSKLNPSTSSLLPGQFGRMPCITRAEFGMLLAGVDDEVCWFAEAKYLDCAWSKGRLLNHVVCLTALRSELQGWDASDDLILSLSRLVVDECIGFKSGKLTEKYRYNVIGIGKSAWYKNWRARYYELFDYVADMDGSLAVALRSNYGRNDPSLVQV